ncbi:MAG: alpha-amylase [Lachnospiraceae bacterium]|nr:alpha-amylase [Lachnospiraceae bacterium]
MKKLKGNKAVKIGLVAALLASVSAGALAIHGKTKAGASSKTNPTMFQGFEWGITSDGNHWNNLADTADELSTLGINSIWLPPAYKADNPANQGYSVYDIYDLGEFDQKGSVRTKYGTKEEYINLVNTMHKNGIAVLGDVVLNHMIGADYTEEVEAVPVDPDDRTKTIGEPVTIEAWTGFDFEGRNNKYSSFKWNKNHFDGVDWDQFTFSNDIFRFYNKTWDSTTSTELGSYDYLLGSDIDLENKEVIKELDNWAKWYVKTTNVDGFRLDAVKHMSASFYKTWLLRARKNTGKALYTVGEYYDYDVDHLLDYIKTTSNTTTLFDFPLQGNFFAASAGDYDMSTLFDGTLISKKPDYAVTFVENHDTQAYMASWFKPLAYTTILTRNTGVPCVFYADYYGSTNGAIASNKDLLNKLLAARQVAAYGKQKDYMDDEDIVGWTREGLYSYGNYGLAAVLSDGGAGTKNMCVGKVHKNEKWIDITGNCEDTVTIAKDGTADFPVNAKSCSVWVSTNAAKAIDKLVASAEEKAKFTPSCDNTVTIYYNTSWNKAYMHYQIDGGEWTTVPGEKLTNTNLEDYKVIKVDLGDKEYLRCCFNNGGSIWDSYDGSNYKFKAGIYTLSESVVNAGAPMGYDPNAPIVEEIDDIVVDDSQLTVYYYTTWETPYVHYSIGDGAWTTVPGVPMDATETKNLYTIALPMNSEDIATLCFNDGGDNWDSRYGLNYELSAGSYIVYDMEATPGTYEDAVERFSTPGNPAELTVYYYNKDWDSAYIHYQAGMQGWTTVPGVAMEKTDYEGLYKVTLDITDKDTVTCCFNNGGNDWDSNNGSNYSLTAGSYYIYGNNVFEGEYEDAVKYLSSIQPADLTVYYYNPSWDSVNMEYVRSFADYLNTPSVEMEKTDVKGLYKATVTITTVDNAAVSFVSENGDIDKNWFSSYSFTGYSLTAGTYLIAQNTVYEETEAEIKSRFAGKMNTATVYYYADSSWEDCNLQFGIGNKWNEYFGVPMTLVDEDTNLYVATITLFDATDFECVFNNVNIETGAFEYDNNNYKNYSLTSGTITIMNGVVTTE